MKQIYIFSPLPPIRSGVAEYSHVLATALVESLGYEVHVVVDQEEISEPTNYKVHHWKEFLYRPLKPEQPIFFQLGNNSYHEYILPFVMINPGVVVLHDFFRMDSFVTLMKNSYSSSEALREIEYCLGSAREASRLTRFLFTELYDGARSQYPELNRTTVEAAVCVAVHNPNCREALLLQHPQSSIVHLPMGLLSPYDFNHLSRHQLKARRRAWNIPENSFVLGSFGVISRYKRIDRLIELVARLKGMKVKPCLLLAGYEAEDIDLMEIIKRYDVSDYVRYVPNPSKAEYLEAVQISDLIYSLRFPSMGEFSLSTAEAMASGHPVFLLQHRFNAYLPSDTYIQIRPTREMDDLIDWTMRLYADARLRESIGQKAKRYVQINFTLEKMLSGYRTLIEAYGYLHRNWRDGRHEMPEHLRPLNARVQDQLQKRFSQNLPESVSQKINDIFLMRDSGEFVEALSGAVELKFVSSLSKNSSVPELPGLPPGEFQPGTFDIQ